MHDATFRAQLVARRTYCRPLGNGHETWEDVCERVVLHQQWLWERALDRELHIEERNELVELYDLMVARKALPSGRILWMGGTEQSRKTEIAMFNCSFAEVKDVYSAVDGYYLLLNGCGVGFKCRAGLLSGFARPHRVQVIRSEGGHSKGDAENVAYHYQEGSSKVWHLVVGDSGIGWAKALGKLLAYKGSADVVRLDFSEIRKAGMPLSGYGWLSSGDEQIAKAFEKIAALLNTKVDKLLTELDIHDIMNLVGTTLTSRRSAQIAMMDSDNPLADEFASFKEGHYENGNEHRSQSNNTLVFYTRPTKLELKGLLYEMYEAGGSEPGLYNGAEARRRAPWFAGTNPCGEILLPDGGLCNLVELDLGKFIDGSRDTLLKAVNLISRANYRQTCVDLKDGVLSARWDETNQFLRLCGVGLTGIVRWLDGQTTSAPGQSLQDIQECATNAVDDMANALGLPRAKAVTTVKPSGTLGKLMDTTEGLHRPLGRYVFNTIKFSRHDDLVPRLKSAGYEVFDDPYGSEDVCVVLPVDNGPGRWQWTAGAEVNLEPAVVQLERYALLMDSYVDHNASVTISYDAGEIPAIADWLFTNWDSYVGVSFILRTDPTKSAEDLGYPYLPQQVVTEKAFREYSEKLQPVDVLGGDMVDTGECENGACPVR